VRVNATIDVIVRENDGEFTDSKIETKENYAFSWRSGETC